MRPPLRRLSDLPPGNTAEVDAARHLLALGDPGARIPEELEGRVWERLRAGELRPKAARRPRCAKSIVAVIAFMTVPVAWAALSGKLQRWVVDRPAQRSEAVSSAVSPSLFVEAPAESVAEDPHPPAQIPRRAVSARPVVALAGRESKPAQKPQVAGIAAETRLLGLSLEKARLQNDPAGALALLGRYALEFPNGVLQPEAALAKVDVLLALDRREDALEVLEMAQSQGLFPGPRLEEIQLLTAELQAELGRCSESLDPFISSPKASVVERALWGRARCRALSGDLRGHRADLARYLQQFPNGSHAAQAQRAIKQ